MDFDRRDDKFIAGMFRTISGKLKRKREGGRDIKKFPCLTFEIRLLLSNSFK